MKATELRIGNLVNENGEVIKIRQETLCDFANGYVVFEPILLTEEWLVKFGFDETIVEGYPLYQSNKGFIVRNIRITIKLSIGLNHVKIWKDVQRGSPKNLMKILMIILKNIR